MTSSIQDKRVIITGGARGIADAAVREFASKGARVVSFDVSDEAGERVAAEATTAGPGSVRFRHVDVSNRAQVFGGVDWAVKELGGLDGLLHIAGVERRASIEEMSEEDLDFVLDVNLKGTFFMNQAVFPHLKEHGGAIVNTGSDVGLVPYPMGAHYSASKAGVMAFTRCAAAAWGQYGIRVNSLVPAVFTPMEAEHIARLSPEELAAHEKMFRDLIPLGGKLGNPATDLAPVLVFLASDDSRFITGQIISVNGGFGQVR
jgi:NAD(P)-dependent dehydrogenase (short-subunit alcohol dehydrogenase family)